MSTEIGIVLSGCVRVVVYKKGGTWRVKVVCCIFSVPVDVKGEVMKRREEIVTYMCFLLGRWEKKVYYGFHIRTSQRNYGSLALQVTEMLCNYCSKAISNPTISAACFTHTHINIYGERRLPFLCWRQMGDREKLVYMQLKIARHVIVNDFSWPM